MLDKLYKNDSFTKLCYEANIVKDFNEANEKELVRAITKKLLLTKSYKYFQFILTLIQNDFKFNWNNKEEQQWRLCCIMTFLRTRNQFE